MSGEIDTPVSTIKLLVGGDWTNGSSEPIVLNSPATGQPVASVAQGDKGDVARAVAAAEKAARSLARMTAFERAGLCHEVADLLTERREQIATSIALEQGKPYLLEALPEVDTAAEMFRDAAEGIKRLGSTVFESSDPRKRVFTVRQPRGVYGIVTPWNFPLAIPSEYLSAGLASGNAMVLKPSEWTPVSAWHLANAFLDAGVPEGTLNLVFGSPADVGGELVSHPGITAIGLTGSSRTGEIVARAAAGRPMLLELGGNGPTLVFEDADLDRAIGCIAFGCFANAGQICNSTERVLAHRSISEDLVAGLVDAARGVRLAGPFNEDVTMGPLTIEATAEKMDLHIADACSRGGQLQFGGRRAAGHPTSLFYEPTVIDKVNGEMLVSQEETFGPIAAVATFEAEIEAVALANDCSLGLNGSIFTRDLSRAMRVAERLEVGTVNVNETSAYWQPHTPVGGYSGKRSGIGRIGGQHTLMEMTQLKTITLDIEESREH